MLFRHASRKLQLRSSKDSYFTCSSSVKMKNLFDVPAQNSSFEHRTNFCGKTCDSVVQSSRGVRISSDTTFPSEDRKRKRQALEWISVTCTRPCRKCAQVSSKSSKTLPINSGAQIYMTAMRRPPLSRLGLIGFATMLPAPTPSSKTSTRWP